MSGQDWPVGTVATATVRGVEGVRVVRADQMWLSAESVHHYNHHEYRNTDVTDVRPLVVLDVEDMRGKMVAAPTVYELPAWLRKLADSNSNGPEVLGSQAARLLADQIEAQTKPPRIPEPSLWGVVADSEADTLTRTLCGTREDWLVVTGPQIGMRFAWSDLADPVLLRPGIEDGAS